jgi:hypothetical protein
MITTASKYFYGLAAVLAVTGVVYGYSTGGGHLGPLSLGYKGGVGDVLGYSILMGAAFLAAFLGFFTTAVRDADPEAVAALAASGAPPAVEAPPGSYWPIVGAFGTGLTVIGVVLNNVFFVAGLVVLAAVAVEWTVQAWSERATGDPAVNREIRNRTMLPVEIPVAGALVAGLVIIGYSRVFLAVSKESAVWIAIGLAALIFGVGALLATRDRLRRDLVAGLLVTGAMVTIGLGIVASTSGEREFHEIHSEEEEGSPDPGSEPGSGDSQGGEGSGESGGASAEESN